MVAVIEINNHCSNYRYADLLRRKLARMLRSKNRTIDLTKVKTEIGTAEFAKKCCVCEVIEEINTVV